MTDSLLPLRPENLDAWLNPVLYNLQGMLRDRQLMRFGWRLRGSQIRECLVGCGHIGQPETFEWPLL